MGEPKLTVRHRNLPHWTLDGSTYFVTFRLATGSLSEEERRIVLDHLVQGNGRFYILAAAVVMLDNVHLLIRPLTGYEMSRVMKGIKGVSARMINALRGTTGTVWQDESWDRIMRDADEFQEKLQYMADNPRKAELVRSIDDYPYWSCNRDFL